MYLSRIALDTNRRETMKALASPQMLHSAIENGFKGIKQRNLWRIDSLERTCYLLVLSPDKPDFAHIVNQFGFPVSEQAVQTKDYGPFLDRLQQGQIWHFRLNANPVRSSAKDKNDKEERGHLHAHVTQEQQRHWLKTRAEANGFLLADDAFDVVQTKWLNFAKGTDRKQEVTIRTATFEGELIITDVDRFKQSLVTGIGRAKAYGCGLLTIARIASSNRA